MARICFSRMLLTADFDISSHIHYLITNWPCCSNTFHREQVGHLYISPFILCPAGNMLLNSFTLLPFIRSSLNWIETQLWVPFSGECYPVLSWRIALTPLFPIYSTCANIRPQAFMITSWLTGIEEDHILHPKSRANYAHLDFWHGHLRDLKS